MKTKITTLLGMACCVITNFSSVTVYGSNNGVVKGINTTESIAPGVKQQLDAGLKNYQVYKIDAKAIHASVKVPGVATAESNVGALSLQLGAVKYDLNLHPRDFTGKELQFLVGYPEGVQAFSDIPVETYQGYVNGSASQIAAFSINENEFKGVMQSNGENMYIEPLKNITADAMDADQYVFYNAKDIVSEKMVCGVNDVKKAEDYVKNATTESNAAGCVGIRIALVADYAFYKGKGSDAVRAAIDMVHVLNIMEALFYRPAPPIGFDLHFRITTIYVSATSNEIAADNELYVYTMLTNFETWGNGGTKINPANFDDAALFTKKNFNGNSGTGTFGLANNAGACSNKGYNIIKADWSFYGDILEAVDLAHEIGHNLNAAHTGGTDIMNGGITELTTSWGSTTPGVINAFISSHSSCIKACSAYAPEPNFSADIKVGCGGSLAVNFTNKTDFTDAATTYAWNFGDGQTSTTQSPAHTYSTAGLYTVSLTATNANGTVTESKKDYIWVGSAANATQTIPVTPSSGTPSYHSLTGPSIAMMRFQALDDIELVSMKMQGNEAGQRIISLTMDSGRTILDQRIITLPAQTLTSVNLNFRCEKNKTYQLVATRTGSLNGTMYYNNLYRTIGTGIIPKTISGLITVNGNHLIGGSGGAYDPTYVNYWYIGFEWQVRRLCSTGVGINDLQDENIFNVYPNPGNGTYTLNFTKQSNDKVNVEVYNIIGEVVYAKNIMGVSGLNTETLDISNLSDGAYLLKLKVGDSQTTRNLLKVSE